MKKLLYNAVFAVFLCMLVFFSYSFADEMNEIAISTEELTESKDISLEESSKYQMEINQIDTENHEICLNESNIYQIEMNQVENDNSQPVLIEPNTYEMKTDQMNLDNINSDNVISDNISPNNISSEDITSDNNGTSESIESYDNQSEFSKPVDDILYKEPKKCDYVCKRGYALDGNCEKAYNLPANINVKGCINLWVTGEYLYYQAIQEHMAVAVPLEILADGDSVVRKGYNIMNFDWGSAFRVGLGVNIGRDGMQLYSTYFRFHIKNNVNLTPPEGFFLEPLNFFSLQDDQTATQLWATWKLKTDFIDLMLARPFYNGKRLILIPNFGLRATRIDQVVDGAYKLAIIEAFGLEGRSNTKSDSYGIGPKIAMDGKWICGKGFGLYGNLAFSILHTHYKVSSMVYYYDDNAPYHQIRLANDLNNTYNYLRSSIESSLGLGWGSYFGCDYAHFDFRVGYDFNVYFKQNLIAGYSNILELGESFGDLFLHGIKVSMQFDF